MKKWNFCMPVAEYFCAVFLFFFIIILLNTISDEQVMFLSSS